LAGNLVSAAVGGDANVEKAILAQDPETLLALKRAEQEFELKLAELEVDLDVFQWRIESAPGIWQRLT